MSTAPRSARMTPQAQTLITDLDGVGKGDATAQEAASILRRAVQSGEPVGEWIYAALRNVTWRMLTGRDFGPELSPWFRVMKHVAALTRPGGGGLAERLTVLVDLVGQSARFAELQPLTDVLSRKHVVALLQALVAEDGSASRGAIGDRIGLGGPNLTRVLNIVTSVGLVERSALGREAQLTITPAGRQAIGATAALAPITHDSSEVRRFLDHLPVGIAVWSKAGKPIIGNRALFEFMDLRDGGLPPRDGWLRHLSEVVRDEEATDQEDVREVRLGDVAWARIRERATRSGAIVAVVFDISAERARHEALQRQIRALEQREARLRGELIALERKVRAESELMSLLRKDLVANTFEATRELRESMALVEAYGHNASPGGLRALADRLQALHTAARHFVTSSDGSTTAGDHEWLDPRQAITEVVTAVNVIGQTSFQTDLKHLNDGEMRVPADFRIALSHFLRVAPNQFNPNVDGGAYRIQVALTRSDLTISLAPSKPRRHGTVEKEGFWAFCDVYETYCDTNSFVDEHGLVSLKVPVERASPHPRSRKSGRALLGDQSTLKGDA